MRFNKSLLHRMIAVLKLLFQILYQQKKNSVRCNQRKCAGYLKLELNNKKNEKHQQKGKGALRTVLR